MNANDRPQFEDLMRSLYAGIGLPPISTDALSALWDGIGTKLSLREVTAIREGVLADLGNPGRREFVFGPRGRFGAAELYAARERMRGGTPPRQAAPDAPARDPWEQAGISRAGMHLARNFRRYSHPDDCPPRAHPFAMRNPDWCPHLVSLELRAPLFAAGRLWAAEVRQQERAMGGPLSEADRAEMWDGCLREADEAVDAIRERHEVGEPEAETVHWPANKRPAITWRVPETVDAETAETVGEDAP